MRVIVDLNKKSLKVIENDRSIFKGEVGADKITLLINKVLVNEYPTITALLSNGRKIGPYATDDTYGNETIDDVTYTTANFTLSKENGFTLSEGKMQVTIWMNHSNGKKEAIGNLLLNVVNTTAFDDENIIVSGDVEGAVVNMRTAIDNAVAQVNLNGVKVNELDVKVNNNKAYTDAELGKKVNKSGDTFTGTMYMDVTSGETPHLVGKHNKIGIRAIDDNETMVGQFAISDANIETYDGHYASIQARGNDNNLYSLRVSKKGAQFKDGSTDTTYQLATEDYVAKNYVDLVNNQSITGTKTFSSINVMDATFNGRVTINKPVTSAKDAVNKEYVDNKINELFGEGQVDATLDTIAEISKALKENIDVAEALDNAIGTKVDKTELNSVKNRVSIVETNKAEKTQTTILEKRMNQLESKIIGNNISEGIVKSETLYLQNARVEGETLYITGLDVESGTLLFDDVTFINGTLVIINLLALNEAKYDNGTLIIGG